MSLEFASLAVSLRAPSDVSTKGAKEFSLEETVFAFGLKTAKELVLVPGQSESLKWRIEDNPETKGFVPTLFLGKSFKHSRSPVEL
jgi:hypothetical protein